MLKKKGVAVDRESMEEAAEALGLEYELLDDAELVGVLREEFSQRLDGVPEDDWIVCPKCGEYTDDNDELVRCPFCGDEGAEPEEESDEEEQEQPAEKAYDLAEGEEEDDGPVEPPAADLNENSEKEEEETVAENQEVLEAELVEESEALAEVDPSEITVDALEQEKTTIQKAQGNMVENAYDLGESLRRIHAKQLWKAEGHKSFRAFVKTMGFSYNWAYDLMDLTQQFDRKTFADVGRRKLRLVANADGDERESLLSDAKSGKSARELEKKVKEKKGETDEKPKKEKGDKITLLSRVGGQPFEVKFRDRNTAEELDEYTPDSYLEVPIAENVSQFIAFKTDDEGRILCAVVVYRREEMQKEEKPAKKSEKKPAKKSEKKPAKKKAVRGRKPKADTQ